MLCLAGSVNAVEGYLKTDAGQILNSSILIKGVVLDEETKLPVGYAVVEVLQHKNSSIQANEKGEFVLQIAPQYQQGDIRVTSLGYEPLVMNMGRFIKKKNSAGPVRIYLRARYEGLSEVEVNAKSKKWRTRKVGFHIDKGTAFHHNFSPLDTLIAATGQEIGNSFKLKRYPSYLKSISFGLAGSGNVKAVVGLKLYDLKNNYPDKSLLPERIIVRIPPHHTGWITVNLSKYDVLLNGDFAVTIEWLSDSNSLTPSTLMAFANKPKDQVMFYRVSENESWKVLRSTLNNVNSIGMYVTVQY